MLTKCLSTKTCQYAILQVSDLNLPGLIKG